MKRVIEISEEIYNQIDKPINDEDLLRYIIKTSIPLKSFLDNYNKEKEES